MKSYRTLAAALCLASSAFVVVPAHAAIEPNGITINGITFNGITINGITFNGAILNGTSTTGIAAGTPVAVTLPPETAGR
jgi:hypothetical protein